MRYTDDMRDLGARRLHGLPDFGRPHGAPQEEDDFEEGPLRPDEEVARLAREHDRAVRCVDALVAELGSRFAQPFPGIAQVVRQVARERRFRRRPAIVLLALFNPLLTVKALSPCHERYSRWRRAGKV